jgi:hypothetical protein
MTAMTQNDCAKYTGVDRKTIGRWIKSGRFIVMDGELIDVEASDAVLKKNRDGKAPRASNAKKKKVSATAEDVGDDIDKTVRQIMLTEGATLSREEAARIHENYMALLTKLEFQQKDGQLI